MDVDIKVKELRPLLESIKAALDSLEGKSDFQTNPSVAALKARYVEYLGGCHRAVVIKIDATDQQV